MIQLHLPKEILSGYDNTKQGCLPKITNPTDKMEDTVATKLFCLSENFRSVHIKM